MGCLREWDWWYDRGIQDQIEGFSTMSNESVKAMDDVQELNQMEVGLDEPTEATESFDAIFKEFERENKRREGEDGKQIRATVVKVAADGVYLDIGFKTEGVLPVAELGGAEVMPGETMLVSVKGRNEEGYYEVRRFASPRRRTGGR